MPAAGTTLSAAELLARGEAALADLEYEAAAEELMRAASAPDATAELRLQAHLKAGIANRILGRDVDARLNFRSVLLAAPETRLPEGTTPKVLSFFESVRQEVELEHAAPRTSSTPAPAPAPDPVGGGLAAGTRGLIAGGVAGGVGLLSLPLCAFCGQGLCLLCPGTLFAGLGGLVGGVVVALLSAEPLASNALAIAGASIAAVVVTALVGGATLATTMIVIPTAAQTLGNGALSPLAQALTTGAGVAAALLSGVAAGAVVWLLAPVEPVTGPTKDERAASALSMAY